MLPSIPDCDLKHNFQFHYVMFRNENLQHEPYLSVETIAITCPMLLNYLFFIYVFFIMKFQENVLLNMCSRHLLHSHNSLQEECMHGGNEGSANSSPS